MGVVCDVLSRSVLNLSETTMKVAVAALLVLAVGAQAQFPFYNNWGYSGYPYGYYGYPYGYSGFAPVTAEVKTAAVATAAPVTTTAFAYSGFPYAYAPAVTANQYHSQDELGQASFGYSHPGQAAVNYRDAAGNQVGSWAYFSPEGKEVRVSYVADSNGFRVLSNALPEGPAAADLAMPEPVQDTAEVAAAKAAHMMALESAKAGVIMSPITSVDDLPKNVEDTPEVAAAKAAHFAALEAAKANDGALPEVVNPTNDLVAPMPVEDTPEVAAAKAEHAAAWEAALAAAQASGEESESRKKRSVFLNAFPWTYPANTLRFAYNTNTMQYPFTTYPLAMPVSVRAAAHPVREAVLSKTVHNPGHAVSYRVD